MMSHTSYRNPPTLQNPAYMGWAFSILHYQQLQGAIGVAVRMQQGRSTVHGLQRMLRQSRVAGVDQAQRPGAVAQVSESMWAFMRGIRGTAAYWADAASDLHAMVRQLGPPTFFITLSAAYMQWDDLALALAPPSTDLRTHASRTAYLNSLSPAHRRAMVRDRPVDVARHFSNRWSLMLTWLRGTDSPLGEVGDVWWRVEFQRRGSAHVHFFVWCEDAPNPEGTHRNTTLPAYIDRHVSTHVPEAAGPLRSLVLLVQQHRHSFTCGSGRGRGDCRFGFPRPLCNQTRLGGAPGGRWVVWLR